MSLEIGLVNGFLLMTCLFSSTAMFIKDLSTLWNLRLTAARGGIRSAWEGNRLHVAAGLLTMTVLVAGMYLLFHYLFSYLTGIEGGSYAFGATLAGRLLTMSLMAFGVFIAVSALISGGGYLYVANSCRDNVSVIQ